MDQGAHLPGGVRWARTWWRCWTWRCWQPGWSWGKTKSLFWHFHQSISQGGTWLLRPPGRHWKQQTNKQIVKNNKQTSSCHREGLDFSDYLYNNNINNNNHNNNIHLTGRDLTSRTTWRGGARRSWRSWAWWPAGAIFVCLFFCTCLFVSLFVVDKCIPWISCSFFSICSFHQVEGDWESASSGTCGKREGGDHLPVMAGEQYLFKI